MPNRSTSQSWVVPAIAVIVAFFAGCATPQTKPAQYDAFQIPEDLPRKPILAEGRSHDGEGEQRLVPSPARLPVALRPDAERKEACEPLLQIAVFPVSDAFPVKPVRVPFRREFPGERLELHQIADALVRDPVEAKKQPEASLAWIKPASLDPRKC